MGRWILRAATVLVLCSAAQAFAGQLAVGKATVPAGQPATVSITYRQGRGKVAVAIGADIAFKAKGLSNPRCAAGSALPTSGPGAKLVTCAEPSKGVLRLAILGLNTAPLPDGELATVTFDVAPAPRHRLYALRLKAGGADARGTDFRLAHRNGYIRTK